MTTRQDAPITAISRWSAVAERVRRTRGVLTLAALCLLPLVFWATALPLGDRFSDLTTSLRSVAVILSLVGTVVFALNLVLGARFKPVEVLFGSLDRMYRAHRANGRIAFLLLLGHALLMIAAEAMSSLENVLRLLLPNGGWTVTLGLIALVLMGISIGLTLYVRLDHETFVYVQRSFGFIFVIALLHVFMTPGAKADSSPLTFYLAGVSLAGLLAFAYRSLFGDVLVPRRDYRVSGVSHLDPAVIEISMTPRDGALEFAPGQFIYVTFRSGMLQRLFHPFSITSEGQFGVVTLRPGEVTNQYHPFSITSAPRERDLKIVVKALGDYTNAMRRLEEGAGARIEGPYGAFSYLNVPNPRQVWIAGGIGVTPFLSMARSLEDPRYEIDFYYAMEHGHQGFFLDEFFAIADRHQRMKVVPIRRDRLGHVTASDIEGVTRDVEERDILICGPPPMIKNLTSQFVEMGIPRRQIHFELFGFGP